LDASKSFWDSMTKLKLEEGSRGRSDQTNYSLFYFSFCAFFAVPVSFLPIHFVHIGLSIGEIAIVAIVANVAVMLGATLAAWSRRRLSVNRAMRYYGWLCFFTFIPIVFTHDLTLICLWMFLSFFFHRALGVLADAAAVRASARGEIRFEHARIWGSVGFVAAVWILGLVTDLFGITSILVMSAIFSLSVPLGARLLRVTQPVQSPVPSQAGELPRTEGSSVEMASWRLPLICMLGSVALAWGASAVMFVYLSVYLEELGWSATSIGFAWSLAVFAEIVAFIYFPLLEKKLGIVMIFRLSLMLAAARWVIMALSVDPVLIGIAQCLHAFSFGTLYIASMKLIYRILPDHMRDYGQSWLIIAGTGLGLLLGRIITGYAAAQLDSITQLPILFFFAAIVAVVSYCLSLMLKETLTDKQ